MNDVRLIADFCAESREQFGNSRVAVVASRDIEFGLARMWGVFIDGRWNADAHTFRTPEDGRQWLVGTAV